MKNLKTEMTWHEVNWKIEWGKFEVPQKAAYNYASLFNDTKMMVREIKSSERDEDKYCRLPGSQSE